MSKYHFNRSSKLSSDRVVLPNSWKKLNGDYNNIQPRKQDMLINIYLKIRFIK